MSETPHAHHKPREHLAHRQRPLHWPEFRAAIRSRWLVPFLYFDWLSQWAVYVMSRMSLFDLLEYCGSLSILIAVIFYFLDAPERTKLKHYQAWQVINSAQGKGGSGGRIEALQELNQDHVSLLGVDVSDAFLQGVKLNKANLNRADLSGADMRNADLSKAKLELANLRSANLVDASLAEADISHANFKDADLTRADLQGLKNWQQIDSMQDASIGGVRNAPPGFIQWAKQHGATEDESDRPAQAPSTTIPSTKP
jgi:hypothetical protein